MRSTACEIRFQSLEKVFLWLFIIEGEFALMLFVVELSRVPLSLIKASTSIEYPGMPGGICKLSGNEQMQNTAFL